jgi:hypothetical protein
MRLRRLSLAVSALVATSLMACSDAPTAARPPVPSPHAARAAAAPVSRPMKGRCDVVARFTSETTIEFSGTCELAHLGRVSVVASQLLVPGPGPIPFTNTATYTAANGDALYTTDTGVGTPTADGLGILLEATQTVVGGTGRFAEASGTATLRGAVLFTGPTTTVGGYAIDGQLTY